MVRILAAGDQALTVEFSDTIDDTVNARVIALGRALKARPIDGISETVPTYRSLLVYYDPGMIRGRSLENLLAERLASLDISAEAPRRFTVPVHYRGPEALDLEALARMKDMSVEALIAAHKAATYRVYMIGFAPGFAYLGGLPEVLATPRLDVPRQHVAAGSIGIGGRQASVNSLAGPSGWRYIGATPLSVFDPARSEPALFCAGDIIRFREIDAAERAAIERRVAAGDRMLEPEC